MLTRLALVCSLFVLTACASTAPAGDPWAGYNRQMFDTNLSLDRSVLEPVAKGYRDTAPKPARDGLHNVLNNLRAPTDLFNNVLQGRPEAAFTTIIRFAVNSTIGIAGLFDPATDMGIPIYAEDFGQTLAVWGVGPGPYTVLPLLGPSNVRDTTGLIVDTFTHPFSVVRYDGSLIVQSTRFGTNSLDQRTRAIDLIDNLEETSVDQYAAYRSLYEQSRANAIRNGAVDVDELPDFEEFDDE
ncbi:MAG: VacJ family lipoprotein [Robiginitomaculum sp.]|nr:VacJ family lipoprotein [Robiginitomaculum sp.]